MSKPFFIWTMRRTGGTSLTDLLMEMSEYKTIQHEPFNLDRTLWHVTKEFQRQSNLNATINISSVLGKAFETQPLIKHCYEIVDRRLNEQLVSFLKNREYRHIFLLRKDEASRLLSLFLALQTDVWGKHGSEKTYEMIRSEEKNLEPFDLDLMVQEEKTAIEQTKEIKSLLERESIPYKMIYFEDFFTGEEETRLHNLYDLFDYLEFGQETINGHKEMIDHIIFNRSQKSHSILEYVPNHKEARELLDNLVNKQRLFDGSKVIKKDTNMENKINIKLYLGAHKTATTHLQGIFLANREKLLEKNIKLSAPRDVRKSWLPSFFKFCNKNDKNALADIQSLAPGKGTWILTEENIAGTSNDFTKLPGMYPKIEDRLSCIKKAFEGSDIELFFSIRSYDSFYRSAYSEVVRNRGYIPFSEFYDEERFKNNSWVEMVRMFANVLPQEKITLWCFEDFRDLVPDLVAGITGSDNAEELIESYKPETTRPSLSQKTMDILASLYPVISREESRKLVERINQEYAISDGYAPLIPFSQEQIDGFKKQYQNDIEIIKKEFPGINFLGVKK